MTAKMDPYTEPHMNACCITGTTMAVPNGGCLEADRQCIVSCWIEENKIQVDGDTQLIPVIQTNQCF
ncbi:hypothetical protein A8C56_23550 [Niabella ginsenosidivorans]|uniref:Uncharacterized protein n=1 Tax=Niabella ginsenosidivorans TaxID=1176587 RepID=A0A1A9IA49_9BACT|nr:hypothetical protein A8C56_23550 [Niabella ginsenosidivorans]